MEKGEKEYLKHFFALAVLVSAIMLFAYSHALSGCVLQMLIIPSFIYIALFFIGIVFNIGPFKYISKLYAEEAERKKQAMRSKQPWE